jgi:hypothetical protein
MLSHHPSVFPNLSCIRSVESSIVSPSFTFDVRFSSDKSWFTKIKKKKKKKTEKKRRVVQWRIRF